MPTFSKTITDFWQPSFLTGDVLYSDKHFTVTVNPELNENDRLTILEIFNRQVKVMLTPEMASKLELHQKQTLSEPLFMQKLNETGVKLHGADYLFYFTEDSKKTLLQENPAINVRRLTTEDNTIFREFQSSVSEQDREDAYVELDHWAVFGSFEQGHLVCAASMYPWSKAKAIIADLGVLTLPAFRGKGHARKVVRAICQHAYKEGYEPQYRCQLDNHASVALAKAAGLTLYGKWDVVAS